MRTTCSSVCVGTLLEPLAEERPRQDTAMRLAFTEPITFDIEDDETVKLTAKVFALVECVEVLFIGQRVRLHIPCVDASRPRHRYEFQCDSLYL